MDDGSITLLVALVILIAFSAFFSASETAFSSLNQIRLKSRAEEGDTSAARVLAMAEKYDKLLSSILIGNNIVNIAAASIGTVLFTKWLGAERGATTSTIVLTVVVLIFGEVTPKTLAKEMPETIATAILFSMVGYFNGNNKTLWVMIQGLVQTLLVRLPMAYFMSIQPNASLTKIGLAAPVSTTVGVVLNIAFYMYLNRAEQRKQRTAA